VALKKLEDINQSGCDIHIRAKLLLCKYANSLLAKQELSAQQVSFFLLDYNAKFTSHSFQNLYWPSFKHYVHQLEHEDNDTQYNIENQLYDCSVNIDQEETVSLMTDDYGKLVPYSAQITDYIYCPS